MSGRTLIRHATVVDGTETARYLADVLVAGGRIDDIAPALRPRDADPDHTVDADGLVLAPGFIDMHAHSDLALLRDTEHMAKVSQGVTTEVLGQDGLSYAPVDDATLTVLRRQIAGWNGDPGEALFTWRSVAGYLDRLDTGVAVNAAYLVPHGVLHALVCGWEDGPVTRADIAAMCRLLRAAMAEGAVGMSAGLTYTPGMYAGSEELRALCSVVGELGGFFAPHHRSYGKGALEAYAEMIELATLAGCGLHLAHACMNFEPNRGRGADLVALLDEAISAGADISLDTYPYLPGATTLAAVLPSWATSGGPDATLARLRDPGVLARVRAALEVHGSDGCHGVTADWDAIEISGVTTSTLDDTVGRTIAWLARARGMDPFDVFTDILVRDDLGTGILQHVGHEDNVRTIMRHARHTAGSDGLLVGAKPHPRAWGTFPRYLGRYCRELGLFSLEECVGHLTGRAAARIGLRDRGLVRTGHAADLVLFDPDSVADTATYDRPRAQATGIPYVWVNGDLALDDGARTSKASGRALRRHRPGDVR
ncbi:N-acyl-D-amino-acid deacylase family protein [Pseudonocardia spinosispora]|uniref:N-acyl-D-amino-acid deacylase family protein n=1 Tax=Pseudonocardia spinosispora TaxID=103441 RepID=UPI0003FDB8A9|nr:D-aminoacylase [Pseudonocardia spinosispora]